jgi:predicted metal-dependent hydrolase
MNLAFFQQLPLFRSTQLPDVAPSQGRTSQPRLRHLQLGARIVAYSLKLAPRRRLAMTIDERGLRVTAPLRAPIKEIEAFVTQHAQWVLTKLDEYASQHAKRYVAMRDGACLPLLGQEIAVRIVAGTNRAHWQDGDLVLEARADADYELLARRALMRRALALFAERMALYADELGVVAPPLALSSARTRWGSCSEKSGIRINWRLIHLPLTLIDYVIVHELAHLIEMNHSARFWAIVATAYPDWRSARRELKSRAAAIPVI